jgi:hypothetical protein
LAGGEPVRAFLFTDLHNWMITLWYSPQVYGFPGGRPFALEGSVFDFVLFRNRKIEMKVPAARLKCKCHPNLV